MFINNIGFLHGQLQLLQYQGSALLPALLAYEQLAAALWLARKEEQKCDALSLLRAYDQHLALPARRQVWPALDFLAAADLAEKLALKHTTTSSKNFSPKNFSPKDFNLAQLSPAALEQLLDIGTQRSRGAAVAPRLDFIAWSSLTHTKIYGNHSLEGWQALWRNIQCKDWSAPYAQQRLLLLLAPLLSMVYWQMPVPLYSPYIEQDLNLSGAKQRLATLQIFADRLTQASPLQRERTRKADILLCLAQRPLLSGKTMAMQLKLSLAAAHRLAQKLCAAKLLKQTGGQQRQIQYYAPLLIESLDA